MLGSPSFWTNLWVFSVAEEKYVIVMLVRGGLWRLACCLAWRVRLVCGGHMGYPSLLRTSDREGAGTYRVARNSITSSYAQWLYFAMASRSSFLVSYPVLLLISLLSMSMICCASALSSGTYLRVKHSVQPQCSGSIAIAIVDCPFLRVVLEVVKCVLDGGELFDSVWLES